MNLKKNYKIKLPSLLTIGFIILLGLIIGYLGPFGSYQMPLVSRLLYWVVSVFVGYFIYYHTIGFFNWYFENKTTHKIIKSLVPSFVSALLLTLFVQFITNTLLDIPTNQTNLFLSLFPQVFIIGFIISVISVQFHKSFDETQPPTPEKKVIAGKLFLDRIPHILGDKLICFVMEDHYLKVYTIKGEHMLLMRMKDALKELSDYQGLQVHRSWWVAKDAVIDIKKQSRKLVLTMENDLKVPVSSTYVKTVKEYFKYTS